MEATAIAVEVRRRLGLINAKGILSAYQSTASRANAQLWHHEVNALYCNLKMLLLACLLRCAVALVQSPSADADV